MHMEQDIFRAVRRYRIIAVLRGISPQHIVNTARALHAGGIRMLDITFDQTSRTRLEDTPAAIAAVVRELGDRILIGAGTVLSAREAEAAHRAGATFLFSPSMHVDVIRTAKRLGILAIPGAITPTEVSIAYEEGATMVKLFPAGSFGPDYLRAVRAPLGHIPLLAMGGVDDTNLYDFLEAGAMGVGIGSSLAPKELVQAGRYEELTRLAQRHIAALGKYGQPPD